MRLLKLSLKGNLVFARAGGFGKKFDCVPATFSPNPPILTFPQKEKKFVLHKPYLLGQLALLSSTERRVVS